MDKKKCKECGQVKPLTEFYKNPSCKLGVDNLCKVCKNKRAKMRYLAQNPIEYYECTICGHIKPSTEFIKNSRICLACFKNRRYVPKKIKDIAYKFKIPCTILIAWTPSAIDCLEVGCNCARCYINTTTETPCEMKKIVMALMIIHGKPDGYTEPTIIEEL